MLPGILLMAALSATSVPPTVSPQFTLDSPVLVPRLENGMSQSAVAFDGTNYLVAWEDYGTNSSAALVASRVTPQGQVLDPLGIDIDLNGYSPAVAFDGTNYVVFYNNLGGSNRAVKIAPDGTLLGQVSGDFGTGYDLSVASSGSEYLLVWTDARNGLSNTDIDGVLLGSDLSVKAYVAISTAANNQSQPKVQWDGSQFFVVWTDARNDPNASDIYGARVSTTGTVDATATPLCTATGVQNEPSLQMSGPSYLVAWSDTRGGVYAATGSTAGTAITVTEQPVSGGAEPTVGFDGSRFLVAWIQGAPSRLFGVNVSTAGALVGSPVPLSTAAVANNPANQVHPELGFGQGQFLITSLQGKLLGTRVAASTLAVQGSEFPVATEYNSEAHPAAASDGTHTFVAWSDDRGPSPLSADGGTTVFGMRLGTDGKPMDAQAIQIGSFDSQDSEPTVAVGGGESLVAWTRRDGTTSGSDIVGAMIAPDGGVSAPFPIASAAGDQGQPAATFDGTNFFVAWADTSSGSRSIEGVHVDLTGAAVEATPVAISTTAAGTDAPAVASDGAGTTLVTWTDSGIFGARVSASGSPLDATPIQLAPNGSFQPSLAFAGGQYALAWSQEVPSPYQILAERLGADGTPLGAPVAIDLGQNPSVVATGADFLIGYERAGGHPARITRMDASGTLLDVPSLSLADATTSDATVTLVSQGPNQAVALDPDALGGMHMAARVVWLNGTTGPNAPPTATPQTVNVTEDQATDVVLAGTDPEGAPLTFTVTSPPAHGTLSGTAPNLHYTPAAHYVGDDAFAFTANDGTSDSAPATVTLHVTAAPSSVTPPPKGGCGCSGTPMDGAPWGLALLLLGVLRTRRRPEA